MELIVLPGRLEPLSAHSHGPLLGMPVARVVVACAQPTIAERPAIDLIRILNEKIAAGEIKLDIPFSCERLFEPTFRTGQSERDTKR